MTLANMNSEGHWPNRETEITKLAQGGVRKVAVRKVAVRKVAVRKDPFAICHSPKVPARCASTPFSDW